MIMSPEQVVAFLKENSTDALIAKLRGLDHYNFDSRDYAYVVGYLAEILRVSNNGSVNSTDDQQVEMVCEGSSDESV